MSHDSEIKGDRLLFRFSLYGFLKNLRFFEPFLILFFRDAGLSYLQIGVLYAVRDIATNLLEIPAGVVADAFGRRKSMVLSFASYIISFIVFYVWPGFYSYALAMVIFAVGEAFRTGTHKALILEHLRLEGMTHLKVPYYGRTRSASQLGSALNSLIAAALVFYSGNYRYVFLASIVPYIADLINLATYPRELDGELVQVKAADILPQMKGTISEFLGLFRNPGALQAIINSSGFDAFFKSIKDYLQPILESMALALPLFIAYENGQRSAIIVGLVYFFIFLFSSYASRNAGPISEHFGNVTQAINNTFLAGAALLAIAGLAVWVNLPVIAIFLFLGLYLLHNIRKPLNVAFISDQINSKVMAAGLSVESQLVTLLSALIAPLTGAIADAIGVGGALLCLGVLMAGVSMVTRVKPNMNNGQAA